MNDRDFIISIRDQCNAQLGAVQPPSGGGGSGPVEPPPSGGTPPNYSGPIDWHLGAPGEVSPTATMRMVNGGQQYAAEVTKTSDNTMLRIQPGNTGTWFQYVYASIPGYRAEERIAQNGGSAEIPLAGAPNGPLVVLFRVAPFPGVSPLGSIAPQVVFP